MQRQRLEELVQLVADQADQETEEIITGNLEIDPQIKEVSVPQNYHQAASRDRVQIKETIIKDKGSTNKETMVEMDNIIQTMPVTILHFDLIISRNNF
jgi:hypothetical protein